MSAATGISMKIMAALSSTLMLACVKALDGTIPVGEVIFFRSCFAMLPLILWLKVQGSVREGIKTANVRGHFIRGLAGTCSMYLSYLALLYISLTDATAINYAAPLFTVLLAALILREKVRAHRWLALLAALFTAGALIQIRSLNRSEKAGAIAFWFTVMTGLTSLVTVIAGWKIPEGREILLLVGCGLFGGITQILLTLSLRYADASLLAPFDYTTLLWSVIIGFLFLGNLPEEATIAGAFLVAVGGIYSLLCERRLRRLEMVQDRR